MKTTFQNIFRSRAGSLLIFGLCVIGAAQYNVRAQGRDDPFRKPVVRPVIVRKPVAKTAAPVVKAKPAAPSAVAAPPIQARIDGYKVVRQRCAELGTVCPKPTSVLTLDEMNVVGIFRTPRGYAAMVEATPIKLSYTIYPGEKFFDGQLVAIEENRLVFRRIVRMSDNREIVSVDNKALQQAGVNQMAASRADNAVPTVAAPPAAAPGKLSAAAVPTTEADDVPVSPAVKHSKVKQVNAAPPIKAVSVSTEPTDAAASPKPAKGKSRTAAKKQ